MKVEYITQKGNLRSRNVIMSNETAHDFLRSMIGDEMSPDTKMIKAYVANEGTQYMCNIVLRVYLSKEDRDWL